MKNRFLLVITIGILLSTSCSKDFLDPAPSSYIVDSQLETSSAGSLGILRGVLGSLRTYNVTTYGGHEDYGHKSMLSAFDIMGNDVVMQKRTWYAFHYDYTGRIQTATRSHAPWFLYYIQIKNVNIVINNIPENTTDVNLRAVRGQALALRGYFHFMLARVYGPTYVGNQSANCVPINAETLSTKRNSVEEVYTKIVDDLEKAIVALDGYTRTSREYIDKQVAQAFLADVYLEMGNWAKAAENAAAARKGYELLSPADYAKGFCEISQNETMWGADINSELSTGWPSFFSHFDSTGDGYGEGGNKAIDKSLYDAIPSTDIRKALFAGATNTVFEGKTYPPYSNFKFRDLSEGSGFDGDYIYLRSALMYYIEAEALARSGNEAQARLVLEEITKTRDVNYSTTATGQQLIDEIILQKRIELWGEGFAFFDLKRLGKGIERNYAGSNHTAKLTIPAGDAKFLMQIPQAEIDANSDVLPNNP